MCTGDLRIRRNPGRSDAPDRTTTNPRPNFCVWPLASQRRAKPPRSQGRKRGSPYLSIHSIVSRYVCIPFDEDTPVEVPSSAGRKVFSSQQKAVPVKNIPFAKEPSAQKRNNTRSFLPGPIKKGKNADCFAVPFKAISRMPRQKRVKIDRQNFPKSFPGKRFLEREQRVEARREEGVPQFSG